MKRNQNRKDTVRRERIIMVLTSAFVLAALVGAGIYRNGQDIREKDSGYEVDFASLEDTAGDKYKELAEGIGQQVQDPLNADDALDYMPREGVLEEGIYMEEAGSGQVEIGKLKKDIKELSDNIEKTTGISKTDKIVKENVVEPEQQLDAPVLEEQLGTEPQRLRLDKEPAFLEASGFYMPVEGEVIMHYDMEHTVYFETLDQYKYNPATIISAPQGAPVYACADATIVCLYSNEEIGNAVCLDLGNGYEVTYGQLKDIGYQEGDQIARGTQIATVAAPTKYYSLEGSNLYFAMKKDGESKNAEAWMPIQ